MSGFLVTLHQGKAYLVHHTLRELLLARHPTSGIFSTQSYDVLRTEEIMAHTCMRYLMMEDFAGKATRNQDVIGIHDFPDIFVLGGNYKVDSVRFEDYMQRFTFLHYALLYWSRHFGVAYFRDDMLPPGQLIDHTSKICSIWTITWLMDKPDIEYQHCDLLVAAIVATPYLLDTVLQRHAIENKTRLSSETRREYEWRIRRLKYQWAKRFHLYAL
jgi:hypothetical protein